MPTVQSVHIPSAMNTISIRGRGKKWKDLSILDVSEYAKLKGISFVSAYRTLSSDKFKEE